MKMNHRKKGSVTILDISGKLTIDHTAELRGSFESLIREGERRFVFDLLDVPWIDSAAIGQLIGCHRRALEAEGEVKVVLNKKNHDLFTFMQLDRVFGLFDDVESALGSFG